MVEFTPGPIILRKGRKAKDVFLIVTGTVEKIRSEDDVYNVISAVALSANIPDFTMLLRVRLIGRLAMFGLCNSRMIRISASSGKRIENGYNQAVREPGSVGAGMRVTDDRPM